MISIAEPDCRPLSLRHAADLLAALAHPVRLQIVEVLRHGERNVGDIVQRLQLEQPLVSRHLGVLRQRGVVSVRRDGRERLYRLGGCRLQPMLASLFDDPSTASPIKERQNHEEN